MSVSAGTLTKSFREDLLAFYAEHFAWSEIESLRPGMLCAFFVDARGVVPFCVDKVASYRSAALARDYSATRRVCSSSPPGPSHVTM